jgi:hypothetical protein
MRHWTYSLLGLALALAQLVGCQQRAPFNPALAGHFFPLHAGLSWTYQVTYPNGAHETISDRVVKADHTGTLRAAALVVSDYSGEGTRSVRADLPQAYPAQMSEVETRYVVEDGYITRRASLGGPTQIRLEERGFLPQYLWPDRIWSNTLSPFEHLADGILKITQSHRTFLEGRELVVPAGRFSGCIRIETEASFHSSARIDDKWYFTDWYAPDIGLVKTLVLSGGQDRRAITRIELLQFKKSKTIAPRQSKTPASLQSSNHPSIVPLSSKMANRAAATARPLTNSRTRSGL